MCCCREPSAPFTAASCVVVAEAEREKVRPARRVEEPTPRMPRGDSGSLFFHNSVCRARGEMKERTMTCWQGSNVKGRTLICWQGTNKAFQDVHIHFRWCTAGFFCCFSGRDGQYAARPERRTREELLCTLDYVPTASTCCCNNFDVGNSAGLM